MSTNFSRFSLFPWCIQPVRATRWAAAVAFIAAALLGLTSCGAAGTRSGPGQSTDIVPLTKSSSGVVPPTKSSSGVQTITPASNELTVDTTSGAAGPNVPWTLVKIDKVNNRIYLSAGQISCVMPDTVHLQETPSEIVLSVTGKPASAPCAAQKVTLVGYVQLSDPVGGRRIVGYSE
jgi:hypothetical protein